MIARIWLLGTALSASGILFAADAFPTLKEVPKRPAFEADIQLEDFTILDDCPPEKICAEGQLFNAGPKPAYDVHLAVEIGGNKHTKPRVTLRFKVDQPLMNPGDRQDILVTLDRKVTYKQNGKEKMIEVGRFNFKVVPKWAPNPPRKSLTKPKK